jgi:hypothetical protein
MYPPIRSTSCINISKPRDDSCHPKVCECYAQLLVADQEADNGTEEGHTFYESRSKDSKTLNFATGFWLTGNPLNSRTTNTTNAKTST